MTNIKKHLINKRHGSQILKLTASRPNHTSYRKVYFNEFVQNYWGCDMGMIIFDLHGGCQRLNSEHYTAIAHFGTLTQGSVHPTVPVLLTKRNKILEPSPQGLISSVLKTVIANKQKNVNFKILFCHFFEEKQRKHLIYF